MTAEEVTTKTNVYYINRKRKKAGIVNPLFVTAKPDGKGSVRLEMCFVVDVKNKLKDIDFYFNEAEWIEDVKKMS